MQPLFSKRFLTPMLAALVLSIAFVVGWPSPPARSTLSAQGFSNTNAYSYWVPPGSCNSIAANLTGTQGLTVTGASSTPVVQTQTTATGTNDATFICNITPPYSIVTTGNGIAITDAVFFYSNQSTLGSQAAVNASGTLNSVLVFSSITYPAAAAAESTSTVAPVRADAGTLLITPTTSLFNTTTATAGAFFSIKFTPATALAWKTDLKQLLLSVALHQLASTATIVNSPGVLVHFRGQ